MVRETDEALRTQAEQIMTARASLDLVATRSVRDAAKAFANPVVKMVYNPDDEENGRPPADLGHLEDDLVESVRKHLGFKK